MQANPSVKVYIQCRGCRVLLCQFPSKSPLETESMDVPHVTNAKITKNLKAGVIEIICEKCRAVVGEIADKKLLLTMAATIVTKVTYDIEEPSLQEIHKNSHTRQYEALKKGNYAIIAFFTMTMHKLHSNLEQLPMPRLAQTYKQLRNFIKFYAQWMKRRQNTSLLTVTSKISECH